MGEIHDLLKSLRKRKGLTLVQLGEITGFSSSYIARLETGTCGTNGVPAIKALKKIATSLNTSYDELDRLIELAYKEKEKTIMADVLLCQNKDCERALDCYRFTLKSNAHEQMYLSEPKKRCENDGYEFWVAKGRSDLIKYS